jgi:hypothetical protein
MDRMKGLREAVSSIDSYDALFGFFPGAAYVAAFTAWAPLIIKGIRGEDVKEDWRTTVSSSAALSAFVLTSASRARETGALRAAAEELRNVAREAAEEDRRREGRATERDARDERRQDSLILLAKLTLAVAAVALVVAIISVING